MESARIPPTVDQIAELVVEKLLAGSLKNLKSANLLSIENDTIEQVDEITRGVISRLLTKQAEETDVPESCPKCSKPLGQKSPQGRSLLSKRGRVNFKTDVCHCEACRLDFFPSVPNSRM